MGLINSSSYKVVQDKKMQGRSGLITGKNYVHSSYGSQNSLAALGHRPADLLKTPALGVPEFASLANPDPPSRIP